MRKYLLHVLIISVVFLLAPTAQVVSYAGAIEDAKEEVRKNPDDAMAHFKLGVAYGESGKYEEAIESYKLAIKIKPDDARAHYNLGVAYNNTGKHQEAIELFKQAIRINPDFAEAHYHLGIAYCGSEDRGSAL